MTIDQLIYICETNGIVVEGRSQLLRELIGKLAVAPVVGSDEVIKEVKAEVEAKIVADIEAQPVPAAPVVKGESNAA